MSTDKLRVYIAGSSAEIARAQLAIAAATDSGFHVVSTWTNVIAKVGEANPEGATEMQRKRWSEVDLDEVRSADCVWFLSGPTSFGAGVEWGTGYALHKVLIASGITKRSIFTALGIEFQTDEAALAFLRTVKERSGYSQSRGQFDCTDVHADSESTASENAPAGCDAVTSEHAEQSFSAVKP